jgi:hypothetical protein
MPSQSHPSWLDHSNYTWTRVVNRYYWVKCRLRLLVTYF